MQRLIDGRSDDIIHGGDYKGRGLIAALANRQARHRQVASLTLEQMASKWHCRLLISLYATATFINYRNQIEDTLLVRTQVLVSNHYYLG